MPFKPLNPHLKTKLYNTHQTSSLVASTTMDQLIPTDIGRPQKTRKVRSVPVEPRTIHAPAKWNLTTFNQITH